MSTSLVVQNDRQCLLRPGDFAVYESTTPYTHLFDEGVDNHFFRFPRAALALPDQVLRDITAVPLGPDNPIARLAFPYFSQLAVSDDLHQGASHAVVEPRIELLRAALASQHGNSSLARAPLEATLSLRITQYIRAHLADNDLSAAQIAAAHSISVRHLYTVLSRSDISLGDWIRTRRLAECRHELAGPNGRLRTIAATGRRWGFVDVGAGSTGTARAAQDDIGGTRGAPYGDRAVPRGRTAGQRARRGVRGGPPRRGPARRGGDGPGRVPRRRTAAARGRGPLSTPPVRYGVTTARTSAPA